METLVELWRDAVGPDGDPARLTLGHMTVRAVLIYVAGTVFLRMGGPRLLGRYAAVDFVLAVVLASVLSRAINGTAPFVATVGSMAALLVVHRLVMETANRTRLGSRVVKGVARPLYLDGRAREEALRRSLIGRHDLEESFRQAGHRPGSPEVEEVWLERDGRVSVISRRAPPVKTPEAPRGS
jgi:uncharacterized membrane protein YcaP (DUF421 family)